MEEYWIEMSYYRFAPLNIQERINQELQECQAKEEDDWEVESLD